MLGSSRQVRRCVSASLLVMLLVPQAVQAQKYKPEDPVPPGAQAKILPISGKVTELRGLAAGLAGMAAGLAGKSAGLEAVLKDLGAKVTEQEIKIELSADVLFDFDKADLRPEAAPSLEKVASVLKSYPNAAVSVEGHTDSIGNDQYNQKLSESRAASVKDWLAAHGVTTSMTTRGWGERKPVAPNTRPDGSDDPEGRQKNRRVEITVKKG